MSNNENNENAPRARRGSVGNAVFSNLFQRSSSISNGSSSVFPPPINMNDAAAQRRRLSVSTVGIHGASPTSSSAPYHFRRASTSTNSESIDECAIEEDDMGSPTSAKTAPTTPFRRMSVSGAVPRGFRNGSIGTDQGQFAWSEQLRSRAESSISGNRASFSLANSFGTSPPRGGGMPAREPPRPTAEMQAPPAQSPAAAKPRQPERRKPDAFQERILKGDFYMD
ncbi:uncharacterized protein DNG_00317 [Cephalotrichum gorgonifer]|uniref:Uncharacterized protein n=1 Tax=Cephalotrichum gorgonifer TaxID=2041049 RepID=A0AAE8SR29_9PEZI|nr:uncharacterized protein DNG_00317 [Cephalotrichum gorgonifer]